MSTFPDFTPAVPTVNIIHLHDTETHNTVCDLSEVAPVVATTDVEQVNCTECLTAWYGIGPDDDK